jgi:hypothetical protein
MQILRDILRAIAPLLLDANARRPDAGDRRRAW